jgi:drug/metabolite transporter (DMT)-like permease
LSIIILGQKIGARSILALFIGFIGVLIISTRGDILGLRFTNVIGVALALGSAVIWSLFWIYNVKDRRDETLKLFLNFSFGFMFILVATLIFSNVIVADINGILGSVYVGMFEMGITFVLWLKALSLSETTAKVSSLIYLVPFLSLVIIHFTVGEDILVSTIVGLVFIVAGIIIQQYGGNAKNTSSGK